MTNRFNIVQAEFFHVGGEKTTTLDALFTELIDRAGDRAPIKTTVRFFDEGGFMTDFAVKSAEVQRQCEEHGTAILLSKGWRQRMHAFRHHRLSQRVAAMNAKRQRLAAEQLHAIADTSCEIAMECSDRSFRPIREDEVHELLEAAARAINVWLFLFEPNDLLADDNTSVAHVMW